MEVSDLPAALVAGSVDGITITARSPGGQVGSGYSGTVVFATSDPAGVVPAPYTFTAADAGHHTFAGLLILKTAGTQSVTVTDAATPAVRAVGQVAVQPTTAAKLQLSGLDAQLLAGATASATVILRDAFDNVATGYRGTLSFSSTDTAARLPASYAFVAADAGTHTFTGGVVLRTTGAQTVTASDPASLLRPAVHSVAVLSATSLSGSQTVTVLPAAASTIAISGLSASVPSGTASSVTLTMKDPFGNVATGYRGTVHFTCTDAAATLPLDHTFTATDAGVATFSSAVVLRTAGNQTLSVADTTSSSISGSSPVTVTPSGATAIVLSGLPTSITAGVSSTMTVTARDAANNIATGYLGTVSFTSSDPQATFSPINYTFVAADNGVHTFASGVTLGTAGSQTVTVKDLNNLASASTVAVSAAAASHLSVTGFPAAATAGVQASFNVSALDPFGNVSPTYAGTVHFSSSDTQAALPLNATLSSGVGTFQATLRTAGTQSITGTDTVTASISGQETGIAVSAAAATHLSVSGFPLSTTAGVAGAVQVIALDGFGNTATGYSGTVHVSSSDPQAALPVDTTLSAGSRSFSVTLKGAGTQSISAADTVTATISGSESGISVSPAAATVLAVHGFPTAVTAGIAGTATVTARDVYGNLATAFAGLVHITSSDGQAVLPADSALTSGSGAFQVTLRTSGTQSITATSGSLSGVQGGTSVAAAAAATLDVTGIANPATAGIAYPFTVTAHDSFGNVAAGYLGTVHFNSTDIAATLPADYPFTPQDQGSHLFSPGVTFHTSGTQTVTATQATTSPVFSAIDIAASVLQYHRARTHDGLYVEPALTRTAAAGVHLDTAFNAPVNGKVYAQPLFVALTPGPDLVITVTELNEVTALNATTGVVVWHRSGAGDLGTPVALANLPCGNIDPLGITGTPVIDPVSRTLFFDAMTTPDNGITKQHKLYGLSIDDGTTRSGWPVDLNSKASFNGVTFDSSIQNQRGALALVNGTLYVPYGGHYGDCGNYHGWVVGVPVLTPAAVQSWSTGANKGGIWAPGGVSSDGNSIFAATGNTANTSTTWAGGESVFRLSQGPASSGLDQDRFTPTDWLALDNADVDIGSSGPLLVDLPGSQLAVQMGKNGKAYLLDRTNLGGFSQGLFQQVITSGEIITGPAGIQDSAGTTVFLQTMGPAVTGCATGSGSVAGLRVYPGAPPSFSVAWCSTVNGIASPIVSTTNGDSNAITWLIGAGGDQRLHGFDADTGSVVFAGGGATDVMGVVQHFNTPIIAHGWIYVGGNGRIYGFHP